MSRVPGVSQYLDLTVRRHAFLLFTDFYIVVLEHSSHQFAYTAPAQTPNVALILHGYIGSAPEQPGVAFSIRLFEIYRQIHRVCPRFSLDALSKTLTHLHHVRNYYLPS
jgi:hypothetical protein